MVEGSHGCDRGPVPLLKKALNEKPKRRREHLIEELKKRKITG